MSSRVQRVEGDAIPAPDGTMAVALSLAKQGWPVFPVRLVPVTKTDEHGKVTKATDKRPLVAWLEGATTDLETIATWWSVGVDHGNGRVTPAPHLWVGVHAERAGLVVVDLDIDKTTGEDFGLNNAKSAGLKLPKTLRYRTRSGGHHLVYQAPKGMTLTIGQGGVTPGLPPGVDVRAGNGLMVYYGPPLVEPPALAPAPKWALIERARAYSRDDGDVAEWLARAVPGKPSGHLKALVKGTDFAELGHESMLAVVSDIVKRGSEPGAATVFERARAAYVAGRPDRERDWDNAAAGSVGQHGLPPVTFALTKAERKALAERNTPAAIEAAAEQRKRETRVRIHGERSAQAGKRVLEDGPLAVELAEAMAADWAWTKSRGLMQWTGRVWASVEAHTLVEEVRRRLDDIEVEEHAVAVHRGDNKGIDKARTLLSRNRARNVADLVIGRLALADKRFDAHPHLLNVANGVVDLRTSTLMPHDPSLYLTKIAPAPFDPAADMRLWLKALEALPPKVADWLQVRFGQAATGHTPDDDKLVLFQANGENGKSTIFAGVLGALGDSLEGGYSVTVPDRLLTADPGDHPTTLMMLRGARLAVFEELPEGRNLNVKRLKDTVGTPKITARHMRKDDETFKATHALMGDTNYQAIVAETDHGTWRRLALVRFPFTFVKSEAELTSPFHRLGDPKVRRHFEASADPGVMRWLVEGARRWYENGETMTKMPKRVVRDTQAWRLDADPVLSYVGERLVRDEGFAIPCDDLARDFNDHLDRRGHRPWSAQTITSRFEGHVSMTGVTRKPVRFSSRLQPSRPAFSTPKPLAAGVRAWVGVRFKDELAPVPMSDEVAELERRMQS